MTASWDFPRSVSSVCVLTAVGARYGLGVEQCLADSGIRRDLLEAPNAEVEAAQELRVVRNLLELLGPEVPLGLEAGELYHPTTYGLWGFTILSSPDVRSAIRVGLKYLRLTSIFCDIRFEEEPHEARFIADDSALPPDVRNFMVERDGATLAALKRDLVPLSVNWARLDLKRSAPRYEERVHKLFGIAPHYEQRSNQICTDPAALDVAMPQGFAPTMKLCEMECRKLIERRRSREGIARQVRRRLQDDPRAIPTMKAMAEALGLSLRTLRRRLANDGTDYESLIDEVRSTLAEELLTTTRMPVAGIAERLGYSEPSCFVRAFTRWKSMPPGRFRELMAKS